MTPCPEVSGLSWTTIASTCTMTSMGIRMLSLSNVSLKGVVGTEVSCPISLTTLPCLRDMNLDFC